MKKSGKRLAITAILTGSVIATASACQQNVGVYGPPEDFANEASSNAETSKPSEENPLEEKSSEEKPSEDYDPEENMIEDVYGPPMDYEAD